MINLFNQILYRPLFNLLVLFYNVIPAHDFGLAIIALTLTVRIVLFPLSIKAQRSQQALSKLSPKLQELKAKHKGDSAALNTATMELYKEHNVNPFGGCLPLLIQLPLLIALYRAFIAGLKPQSLSLLYSFIHNPGTINSLFIGLLDITAKNHLLAIVAGVFQFLQAHFNAKFMATTNVSKEMASMNKQMLYFFPILIVIIGWNLPAGLLLYWVTTTVFSVFEQWYVRKVVAN